MSNKNCNPFGEIHVRKNKVFKEKRSEFRIESKDDIISIAVDKGLIDSLLIKKCDYLILNCTKLEAVFVELKGRNIDDGVAQILSSNRYLGKELLKFSKKAIIVVTRFDKNEFKTTSVIKLERELKTKIIVKEKTYTYK